ncbi:MULTISPECIES: alpha-1,2-fucosyltransferase [Acinetobacter]|uniref:alpha-1,2-fucosyltransferase n=1 Tax=Acinetobacter TaxID=469 RepID=UPI000EA071DA|nr:MULTISPECIES: alpha-1,2-fucosyltransferase [Acinetobacter]RKG46098.1 alpha-1,2-fucosyltransferase [Acinetobacter cumulans]RZG61262.1 alpha-1,2-fucosyltransferase [Acinetobacter sp. WCHAc060006]
MFFEKSFIIIKLKGGLGNQIFQFATALNHALDNECELIIDISHLNHDALREYELVNLNLKYKILKNNLHRKFFIFFISLLNFRKPTFFTEKENFNFYQLPYNDKSILILDGYFQNFKYFEKNKQNLIDIFNIDYPNDLNLINIRNTNSVALHVRRGDYINNQKTNNIHGSCSIEYYNSAIKKFNDKSYTFFIFSDDINWVKDNIKITNEHYFVSDTNLSDFQEFVLMKNCKHFIISNSTFSWWAAWLSNTPQKTVICPKNWFKDPTLNNLSKKNIINNWIKI